MIAEVYFILRFVEREISSGISQNASKEREKNDSFDGLPLRRIASRKLQGTKTRVDAG